MMKYIVLVFFITFQLLSCKEKSKTDLTWMTISEASTNHSSDNKKKYLVDVYTDWCGWCKVMDKKTFTDPEVIKYLNENFHVVKLNAEQKESINFKGKKYDWISSGRNGINTLALELLQGRMSYPSIVYLNEKLEPIKVSPGYKDPTQLMSELKSL